MRSERDGLLQRVKSGEAALADAKSRLNHVTESQDQHTALTETRIAALTQQLETSQKQLQTAISEKKQHAEVSAKLTVAELRIAELERSVAASADAALQLSSYRDTLNRLSALEIEHRSVLDQNEKLRSQVSGSVGQ